MECAPEPGHVSAHAILHVVAYKHGTVIKTSNHSHQRSKIGPGMLLLNISETVANVSAIFFTSDRHRSLAY